MFDIGWSEMAVILLVALIVIGPKDLPRVARTMGRWAAKGRAMAREFQTALEDMAREAELDKVKQEIEKAGRTNIGKTIEKTIDPTGELTKAFDPSATGGKPAGGQKPNGGLAERSSPADASPADPSPAKASAADASPPKPSPAKPSSAKTSSAKTSPAKTSPAKTSPAKTSSAKSSPANSSEEGKRSKASRKRTEAARETVPAEPS
jgi:sec-independent protein translocase protein TatB